MAQLKVQISLDSAASEEMGPELAVASYLTELAHKANEYALGDEGNIRDANGVKIGQYRITGIRRDKRR